MKSGIEGTSYDSEGTVTKQSGTKRDTGDREIKASTPQKREFPGKEDGNPQGYGDRLPGKEENLSDEE